MKSQSKFQLFLASKPARLVLYTIAVILAAFLVIWLNLSWRSDLTRLPPDSGFYAYFGKAILHGQVPYRDVWDDKPPLGYYLNALALMVFGQSAWGIWWSSVVWILGCTILAFVVFRKLFGKGTAWIMSPIFLVALMNPEVFQGGNLMEVYALAPQLGIIGVSYLYFTGDRKPLFAVLLGSLTAITFLIKQPTITFGVFSLLVMVISSVGEKKIRQVLRLVLGFFTGFIIVLALVSLYWLVTGNFSYLLDGSFIQGFSSIGGTDSRIKENFFYALINVFPNLFIGRLYTIAILASLFILVEKLYQTWLKPIFKARLKVYEWVIFILFLLIVPLGKLVLPAFSIRRLVFISMALIGLFILVKYYRLKTRLEPQEVFSPSEWVWVIAVLSLPVEVVMVSLGGRYIGHYFITMIPAVLVTIAFPIWKALSMLRRNIANTNTLAGRAVFPVFAVSILVWGLTSLVQDIPSPQKTANLAGLFSGQVLQNDIDRYILQTTQPDDKVLVWHIHLGIDFETDRWAPSRFLFPVNLFIPANNQNHKLSEYLDDLEKQPPELILVQRPSSLSLPFVDESAEQVCAVYCAQEFDQAYKIPEIRQQWLRFQEFFQAHYALDTKIYDWIIFRKVH